MTQLVRFLTSLAILIAGPTYDLEAQTPILKIGVSVPMSGCCSEYGYAVLNGIQLAREEESAAFEGIEFITDDNRYDGQASVGVFRKQRDLDRVDLNFVWGDVPSLAVAPLAELHHAPTVAVLTDPIKVRAYKHVIRFLGSHFQYAQAMAQYLDKHGFKNIALIHSQSPYDTNHANSFQNSLMPGQRLTVLGSLNPADTDFRTLIMRCKAGGFDVLGLYIYPTQIGAFFKQAQGLRLNLPLFGADDFESVTAIRDSNGGMENALFASHGVNREFQQRYLRRFNNDSQVSYAANAYEFAKTLQVIRTALQKKPPSSEEILNALKEVPARNGVLGQYRYEWTERDGQHFDFPIVIKKIVGLQTEQLSARNNPWRLATKEPSSSAG